jgi:hypothetical protein
MLVALVGLFLYQRAPAYEWVLPFMIVFALVGIATLLYLFWIPVVPGRKKANREERVQ